MRCEGANITFPPFPTIRVYRATLSASPGEPDANAEREHPLTSIYKQHVDRIYRYHLARTENVEDAQDLTAETFHAALESFTSFDPAQGSVAAWLTGIARHKLVDHFRRSQRTLAVFQVEDQPDPTARPEEASAYQLQLAQVSTALRNLPADRAEALSLHFFAGLSLSETAQVMHRSDQAVKKLIHRGLADLRTRLAQARTINSTLKVIL